MEDLEVQLNKKLIEKKQVEIAEPPFKKSEENIGDAKLRIAKDQCYSALQKGQILSDLNKFQEKRQRECNHCKGGYIQVDPSGKFFGITQGSNGKDYSVIKHKFFWGDVWVICNRCGKKWKPGDKDYEQALNFPTSNQNSESTQWKVDVSQVRDLTRGT